MAFGLKVARKSKDSQICQGLSLLVSLRGRVLDMFQERR